MSKLKVFALCSAAAMLASGSAFAAEAEEAEVSATFDLPILSAYVWRGQVLNDEGVLQPSLTVAKGGFAINWWGNMALTDQTSGDEFEFTEHDIGVSYGYVCPKTDISATVGVVNYDFPNQQLKDEHGAHLSLINDTREAYAILGFPVLLSPTLSAYYDFKEADGWYGSLGVSHSIELSEKASATLAASIGAADGDWHTFYYGVDDASLSDWSVGLTIPFAACESLTITPGVMYTAYVDSDIEEAADALYLDKEQVVGSLKASYAF